MEKEKIENAEKEKIQKAFSEIEKELKEGELTKKQLFDWFKEEIERKDAVIDKLRKDNHILFNTAIRSNDRELEKLHIDDEKKDREDKDHLKSEEK